MQRGILPGHASGRSGTDCSAFGGQAKQKDRYLFGVWGQWLPGRPRLFASAVSMDCVLANSMMVADHTLFAGLVVAADVSKTLRPLLWHDRGYARLRR
ncbi:MAG: flavin reductase family protein [Rhizobium pusense]|nr:flavin reductase family protein [Agrobacterium pusense]